MTSIDLVVPKRGEAEAAASEVPNGEGAALLLSDRDRARDQRRARHAGVDRGRGPPGVSPRDPARQLLDDRDAPAAAPAGEQRASAVPDVSRHAAGRVSAPVSSSPRSNPPRANPLELEIEALDPERRRRGRRRNRTPRRQRARARPGPFRPRHLRGFRRPAFASRAFLARVSSGASRRSTKATCSPASCPRAPSSSRRRNARRDPRAATRGGRRASWFGKRRDAPASRPGDGGRTRRFHRLDPDDQAVPEQPFLGYARKRTTPTGGWSSWLPTPGMSLDNSTLPGGVR